MGSSGARRTGQPAATASPRRAPKVDTAALAAEIVRPAVTHQSRWWVTAVFSGIRRGFSFGVRLVDPCLAPRPFPPQAAQLSAERPQLLVTLTTVAVLQLAHHALAAVSGHTYRPPFE